MADNAWMANLKLSSTGLNGACRQDGPSQIYPSGNLGALRFSCFYQSDGSIFVVSTWKYEQLLAYGLVLGIIPNGSSYNAQKLPLAIQMALLLFSVRPPCLLGALGTKIHLRAGKRTDEITGLQEDDSIGTTSIY